MDWFFLSPVQYSKVCKRAVSFNLCNGRSSHLFVMREGKPIAEACWSSFEGVIAPWNNHWEMMRIYKT